jgi:AraC-like DNA-binding protein
MPLNRYLCRVRLRAAFDAMLDGKENLTDVALGAGFSSHAHFSSAFRAEFGRTPSGVRDALQEAPRSG